jgi:hypothetical protein
MVGRCPFLLLLKSACTPVSRSLFEFDWWVVALVIAMVIGKLMESYDERLELGLSWDTV